MFILKATDKLDVTHNVVQQNSLQDIHLTPPSTSMPAFSFLVCPLLLGA